MMNGSDWFIIIIIAAFIFLFGMLTGGHVRYAQTQSVAAATTCAQYNPDTGEFEWLN